MSTRPLDDTALEALKKKADDDLGTGAVAVASHVIFNLVNEVQYWRRARQEIRDAMRVLGGAVSYSETLESGK